jgi:FkbM family methyltransferase
MTNNLSTECIGLASSLKADKGDISRAIEEPIVWQPYWKFAFRAFKRAIYGRSKIRLAGKDFIVAYEARSARHEDDLTQIADLATDKTCVFDVGANVGLTSLVIASRAPGKAMIYAFDASESCCLVIRENAMLNKLNHKINVVNAVVGGTDSHIHSFNWDFVSGNASIVIPSLANRQLPLFKASVSLDAFAEVSRTSPEFVKVDVEGAELQVLDGMKRILTINRPVVWMEVHSWPGRRLRDQFCDALNFVNTFGYEALNPATKERVSDVQQLTATESAPFARCHVLFRPIQTTCA